ncbi:MAG: DUF3810 domain-containing protein [Proteiniphilum sp.]
MTERGVPQTAERIDNKQKWKYLLIVGGVLLLTVFIFSRSPMLSEGYMRTVYPVIATVFSFISGIFPFSLYDLFIVAALLWFTGKILFVILRKIPVNAFLFALVRFIVIVVAWFYFGWGVAYFRDDFYTRNEVREVPFDKENLRNVAIRFIGNANLFYGASHDMNKEDVREELEHSYLRLQRTLSLPYPNGKRRVKAMIFESFYTKMGVSGYFGPFFNEIHVNNYGLPFTYPFTLAHEMAHQYGIAPESEASLYAFIICASSSDPVVRYSAYVSVLGYLLRDARRLLPDDYESLISAIRPEIIADLQRNSEHWMAARNETLSDTQDKMYDVYLKTNQISSGRDNYSEVVGLLVSSYNVFLEK